MMELLETEKEYVNDLQVVVERYFPKLLEKQLPPPDDGQERIIFGNIIKLYEWHRE